MDDTNNIQSLKETNKVLFQKMGLLKHHIEAIEEELKSMEKSRALTILNKDLEESQKKKNLDELIRTSNKKITYHIKTFKEHILADDYSIKKFIEKKNIDLKNEKEKQLQEAESLGFITAEEADKRRQKWDRKNLSG